MPAMTHVINETPERSGTRQKPSLAKSALPCERVQSARAARARPARAHKSRPSQPLASIAMAKTSWTYNNKWALLVERV